MSMFRRTKNLQGDLFKDISTQLSDRKQRILEDPNAWHNVFFREVVSRIDEQPYAALYADGQGRPNASVRIMIAMMILKEGQGWSDEQLYEACRFDLKVMRSLGLLHIDQDVPTESTYYEFRGLLGKYNEKESHDLLKDTFAQITSQQVKDLNIGGKKIRLDSKLINSNIAKSNRLELILEVTRKYVQYHIPDLSKLTDPYLVDLVKQLQTKSTSNISYSLIGDQKKEMLLQLGYLIQYLLSQTKADTDDPENILARIYREQYVENSDREGQLELRDPRQISAASIQSVHDPDAAYRSKGEGPSKQTVSGYHANITESCDEKDGVNLILDVEVIPANICEDAFLESAVDNSESVLQEAHQTRAPQIETVITDGGYDSITNRAEMVKEERPQWDMIKSKGAELVYEISEIEEGQISVTHKPSNQKCKVQRTRKGDKYVIINPCGQRRYMTTQQIENYKNLQLLKSQKQPNNYNLRANVESTIHQCFHRLQKRNKIKYRRQIKCQWYVLSRAFWVNMIRIRDYNLIQAEKAIKTSILALWAILTHHITIRINYYLTFRRFPYMETIAC